VIGKYVQEVYNETCNVCNSEGLLIPVIPTSQRLNVQLVKA